MSVELMKTLLGEESVAEPIEMQVNRVYTVTTRSGSTYKWNSGKDYVEIESRTLGPIRGRGYFFGSDDLFSMMPNVIIGGLRLTVVYVDDDGYYKHVSTSPVTNVEVEMLS